MLSLFLNILNKIKVFPYFFLTPTPYALGTAAVEIFITLQNLKKKKLIILKINILNSFSIQSIIVYETVFPRR